MALPETTRKAKYDKENCRHFHLKYNNVTDADILSHLEKQSSIQGYIKALIRADMAHQDNKEE